MCARREAYTGCYKDKEERYLIETESWGCRQGSFYKGRDARWAYSDSLKLSRWSRGNCAHKGSMARSGIVSIQSVCKGHACWRVGAVNLERGLGPDPHAGLVCHALDLIWRVVGSHWNLSNMGVRSLYLHFRALSLCLGSNIYKMSRWMMRMISNFFKSCCLLRMLKLSPEKCVYR